MTTSNSWQEIDRIFAAALEYEPAARAAFLDEACAGNRPLRDEVESLLAHDRPESLLGTPAVEEATRLLAKDEFGGPPSEQIGPYQILRSLGVGGMGKVYLAQDTRLHRLVAVKLLSEYQAGAAERMGRFRQEALAASALNHPNILTIYEIGEFDGHSLIATEFVDGLTLGALMKTRPLGVELALDIAIQVASALAAAHATGIIHRDIKPENIMVRVDGLVKVLDFGIAKFTQSDGQELKGLVETMPGAIIGTAAYMSPEQARGAAIDTRTDIWSLGAILYELVAQRRPFSGATPMDLIAAVLEREPAPLPSNGSVAVAAIQPIVSKALQKNRDHRYQTAAELLNELRQLKQKLERDAGRDLSESRTPIGSHGEVAGQSVEAETAVALPVRTAAEGGNTSSAEYVVHGLKEHKYTALVLLLLLLTAVGFLANRYLLSNESQPIESIAVMPFLNESGSGDIDYLSDGMTDMLITSLSQLPKLSVKARSSVFRYKGKDASPHQVGQELNVQAILNGRVVQRGSDLTLHIELVDVKTETALWSGDYNRSMTNLVALQSEIARDVSQKLRVRLSGADEQKLTKNYTSNAEAYQLYLKGRYHVFKLTPAEIQTGMSYFQQAIDLDPNYALAYAGLADAYRGLVLSADMRPTEFFPKAKVAAQKAIEIDDSLAEAHAVLGFAIFWYDWDWIAAENQYKRALEINPNGADTHWAYSVLLSSTGRHPEALAEIKRAIELDPLNLIINASEGLYLEQSGKTDEALASLQKTFELNPNFWIAHLFASSAYIDKGMYSDAIAEAHQARALSGVSTSPLSYLGYAQAKSGKQTEARATLQELLKLSSQRYVPAYNIALIYNGLDERDKSFDWLERGLKERDPRMSFLKVEPKWKNLRNDPRFVDLMRRVGFIP